MAVGNISVKGCSVVLGSAKINLHTTVEKAENIQRAANYVKPVVDQLTDWELRQLINIVRTYRDI